MFSKFFLSFAVLTIGKVFASKVAIRESPITLPITAHISTAGGTSSLLNADKIRLETLRLYGSRQSGDASLPGILLPATDSTVIYTTNIGIGTPPTNYSLLVDTGSSNTWIGARKPYKVSRTSRKTNDTVSVEYGSGAFIGTEYLDTLYIDTAAITQSIGIASASRGFKDVDGILGIGPATLTRGTLSPNSTALIPTVTDNLVSQKFLSKKIIGISFEPNSTGTSPVNGQLDFGGTNPLKFIGNIHYTSITTHSREDQYWGIDQDITYGHSTPIATSSFGIVDTGTTLLYLSGDAFLRYMQATQAVMDKAVGLLTITAAQYDELESLFFTIGGIKYEFTANAQLWPRALNGAIGGSPDKIYLIVATINIEGISGINGFVWLQRFYSVFDTDEKRIGFANTPFTAAKTN